MEEIIEMQKNKEAKARATILEIVGDIPDALPRRKTSCLSANLIRSQMMTILKLIVSGKLLGT